MVTILWLQSPWQRDEVQQRCREPSETTYFVYRRGAIQLLRPSSVTFFFILSVFLRSTNLGRVDRTLVTLVLVVVPGADSCAVCRHRTQTKTKIPQRLFHFFAGHAALASGHRQVPCILQWFLEYIRQDHRKNGLRLFWNDIRLICIWKGEDKIEKFCEIRVIWISNQFDCLKYLC